MPENRLAKEKSPYLLQHADNPVDWYPWGEEAFEKARKEDKPVFLSIGYATCHWCHVMAHESFEDEAVAALLNSNFVSIKVDREERPDIDKIYMDVCQALTGRGGWPLSAVLTPHGTPFFAGTYFPRTRRQGMPGFLDIMTHMATMWKNDRQRLEASGESVIEAIYGQSGPSSETSPPGEADETLLEKGYTQLERAFDPSSGGFSQAPKFPTPHHLTFLLRWYHRGGNPSALHMVEKTLEAMRRGGIFDQIGYGFHRYSVDDRWFAPHFEKMLYDQALLAMAYMDAYLVTRKKMFGRVAQDIFTYVLRDMTAPDGGFCAAEDADSEGREGLFYLWTPQEVKQHLGEEEGGLFCRFFGIVDGGNFEEGKSIPYVRMPLESFAVKEKIAVEELEQRLEKGRRILFAHRKERKHPLKDDKVLTSWNGLMIAALARGYQIFDDDSYRIAAEEAARFVLKTLTQQDGRLLRRYRDGEAAYPAYLDDYAFLSWGLIELYEATFDVFYLETALSMTAQMVDLFWDKERGGLFFTGAGNEPLVAQSKDVYDGALPSGNSVALDNFSRLSRMTGNTVLEDRARKLLSSFIPKVEKHPMAYTHFLNGCSFFMGPTREIVISGDMKDEATRAMIDAVSKTFLPNTVLLGRFSGESEKKLTRIVPFVEAMEAVEGRATAYVCEDFACRAPTTDINDFSELLHSRQR